MTLQCATTSPARLHQTKLYAQRRATWHMHPHLCSGGELPWLPPAWWGNCKQCWPETPPVTAVAPADSPPSTETASIGA